MKRRITTTTSAVTLALLLMGAPPFAAVAQERGELKLEERTIKLRDGEPIAFELGTIYVPENRAEPSSRLIGLGFARLPAVGEGGGRAPVFVLPGGPGSSYVSGLLADKAASQERAYRRFASLRRIGDVVLVDQRGFSEMGDKLWAWRPPLPQIAERPTTIEDRVRHARKFARTVVAKYAEADTDLRGYTAIECAHDVDDLRRALGYEKIVLNGTSFGSQWSFMVMRLYPDSVARAILSGVEPINHGYDSPSGVFAAVRRMWKVVDASPKFEPYLPEGGMNAAARAVIERLEAEPLKITDEDGEVQRVLGPDDFPWHEPASVLALYHERYELFADGAARLFPRPVSLIGPLIDTSLGVTLARRRELWNDPAVRYLSRRNFAPSLATDEIWPSPDVGNELRNPILCETPVVFAQGDWDVKTPLENTLEIAPYFPNSRVIIAERGGHGVLWPIEQQLPDVWKQIEEFLKDGDLDGIPVRVQLKPSREFTKPRFDPPPR